VWSVLCRPICKPPTPSGRFWTAACSETPNVALCCACLRFAPAWSMSLAMPAPVRALRLAQPPAPVCRLRRCAPSCVNARAASRGSLQCHRVAGEGKELSSTSASDNVRVDGLLGLDQICNDFECKSSPAIESTLRQARFPCARAPWETRANKICVGDANSLSSSVQCARDIDNLREGQSRSVAPFAEKVLYTDGLAARWTGRELGLRTYAPITTLLTSARSVVNSMRMDGLDAAYIGWSLSGQTPAGPVSLVRGSRGPGLLPLTTAERVSAITTDVPDAPQAEPHYRPRA